MSTDLLPWCMVGTEKSPHQDNVVALSATNIYIYRYIVS